MRAIPLRGLQLLAMTRDFAKHPHSHRRKTKPKSSVPAWVWLFTGSVLGAFVMFLFYLTGIPPQPGSENLTDVLPTIVESIPEFNNSDTDAKEAESAAEEEPEQPRFTFYKQLENEKFEVDDKPLDPQRLAQKRNVEYVIQVASYRSAESADRLRAQLILLNFNAWVDSRDTRSHERFYSVKVGPFATSAKRDNARSTLYENGFDDILVLTQMLNGE